MPETPYGCCTLIVAEMPVSLDNPHLQVVSIWPAHEHVHIIVGLKHYGIRLPSICDSFICHAAKISHNHELATFIRYGIADSLGSVMRHNEVPHLHPAYQPCTFFRQDTSARGYMV